GARAGPGRRRGPQTRRHVGDETARLRASVRGAPGQTLIDVASARPPGPVSAPSHPAPAVDPRHTGPGY
ncbi:hypothetical protein R0J91_16180, partial [Micrococcus sp. SIMBA_131]